MRTQEEQPYLPHLLLRAGYKTVSPCETRRTVLTSHDSQEIWRQTFCLLCLLLLTRLIQYLQNEAFLSCGSLAEVTQPFIHPAFCSSNEPLQPKLANEFGYICRLPSIIDGTLIRFDLSGLHKFIMRQNSFALVPKSPLGLVSDTTLHNRREFWLWCDTTHETLLLAYSCHVHPPCLNVSIMSRSAAVPYFLPPSLTPSLGSR